MGFSRTIKIKKRSLSAVLTMCILVLPFAWGTFFDLLKLPNMVKYTADAAWLALLLIMLFRKKVDVKRNMLHFVVCVVAFFIYCLFIYILKYQSAFYFFWGARNNFRYYVFFFAVILFFADDDIEQIFKVMDILFWVHFVVSIIQYFAFGYKQDYLGGIFGVTVGCNAMTIIFFFIVLGRSLLKYMEKNESFASCFAKCAAAILIAALAELKFFFVLFLLILGMATLITAFSWRKLTILLLCVVLIIIGSYLLIELFEFDDYLSLGNIWEMATQEHYSSQKTVNRLSAIPTLARSILTEFDDRLFGLGLGNCDTSSFDICNTPFYQNFGYLRYTYFSCAFLFLEVGYIGIVIYMLFFVLCFVKMIKLLKTDPDNSINIKLGMMMAVLAMLLVFYNSSLRTEAGYLVFFILAIPFIGRAENKDLAEELQIETE